MAKSLHYLKEFLRFSSIKHLFFLGLVLNCEEAAGECRGYDTMKYVAEGFGHIIIDWNRKSMDIFKTIPFVNIPLNVANCCIQQTTENYLTISSVQPTTYNHLHIRISKEYGQSPDSIVVRVKIPESEAGEQYLRVYPSFGREEMYLFSSCGLAEFYLKKYDLELDNYFSVVIFPIIKPFERASSWGDSETLSFMDLRMDKVLDLWDPDISTIEIEVPDYSNEIFWKWVILDDFVLKDDGDIIWRNIRFVSSNTN